MLKCSQLTKVCRVSIHKRVLTSYNCELEWDFIQGLSYQTQTPDDAEFVQLIYTSRLRKDKHQVEHALTRSRLVDDYALGDNPDVLFSFADALYTDFRWAECYAVTSRCVFISSSSISLLPLLFPFQHTITLPFICTVPEMRADIEIGLWG